MSDFKTPAGADEAGRALNTALAKAQGEFPAIPQTKEVNTPKFSYTYAPLEKILELVRPVLSKHGLSLTQPLDFNGSAPILRTELRHEAGAMIVSTIPLSSTESPQQFGSGLTYMRRYTVTAILGIATEEDDDGQAAEDAKAKPKAKPKMIDEAQRGQIDTALQALIEGAPQREGQLSWPAQLRERFEVQSKEELSHERADETIAWLKQQLENAGVPF